jgi:tryptophan synthase alpha chain
MLAPNSPDYRIKMVVERPGGFLYLVSLRGVTGVRQELPPDLESFVVRVRKQTAKPLCVGFGISNVEQAKRVGKIADGVIVGSRLVQLLRPVGDMQELTSWVDGLRQALNNIIDKEVS